MSDGAFDGTPHAPHAPHAGALKTETDTLGSRAVLCDAGFEARAKAGCAAAQQRSDAQPRAEDQADQAVHAKTPRTSAGGEEESGAKVPMATQQIRNGLAQARELFAARAEPPYSTLLRPVGMTVQELCFLLVLDTHKKRICGGKDNIVDKVSDNKAADKRADQKNTGKRANNNADGNADKNATDAR